MIESIKEHNRFYGLPEHLEIVAVGPFNRQRDRHAAAFDHEAALGALYRLIGSINRWPGRWGSCPFFSPARGAFVMAPSIDNHCQSMPWSVSYSASPSCQSLRKTSAWLHSWKRRWALEPVRRSHHVVRPIEDGVEGAAVIDARVVAAQRMRLARGQKRLDALPEFVGQAPSLSGSVFSAHKQSSRLYLVHPQYNTLFPSGIGS